MYVCLLSEIGTFQRSLIPKGEWGKKVYETCYAIFFPLKFLTDLVTVTLGKWVSGTLFSAVDDEKTLQKRG